MSLDIRTDDAEDRTVLLLYGHGRGFHDGDAGITWLVAVGIGNAGHRGV